MKKPYLFISILVSVFAAETLIFYYTRIEAPSLKPAAQERRVRINLASVKPAPPEPVCRCSEKVEPEPKPKQKPKPKPKPKPKSKQIVKPKPAPKPKPVPKPKPLKKGSRASKTCTSFRCARRTSKRAAETHSSAAGKQAGSFGAKNRQ